MKKRLLVGLVVFLTCGLYAQNKKLIGVWKINYQTFIDTLEQGKDQYNTDPHAYFIGTKKISREYIVLSKIIPKNESESSLVTIKEGKGVFLITGFYSEKEIKYSTKTNKHYITTGSARKDSSLLVKYDEKNDHLSFVEEETGIVVYDFSRI